MFSYTHLPSLSSPASHLPTCSSRRLPSSHGLQPQSFPPKLYLYCWSNWLSPPWCLLATLLRHESVFMTPSFRQGTCPLGWRVKNSSVLYGTAVSQIPTAGLMSFLQNTFRVCSGFQTRVVRNSKKTEESTHYRTLMQKIRSRQDFRTFLKKTGKEGNLLSVTKIG